MSKFISSNVEPNSALVFDKDEFSLSDLVAHLVSIGVFLCCRSKLYFYNSDKGIFIPLPESEIWFCICRYVSRAVTDCLEPKDIKKLIAKLKLNIDLHFEIDKFDTYEDLININNGVFNIRTGELASKKREYYFTSNIDAAFLEDVSLDDCPTFKKFYESSLCGDEKSLTLLLQIIGYLCCNYSSAKKAFMFIGEKNCGKSKILEFITRLIGENNVCNIPLHKLGNRFNVAELNRNKVNIQAELSLEPLREIETFKNAVGGDTLCGEDKGENLFYFKNKCKLLFAGNGMPALKTQDTTQAFVSRLVFLIFPKEIPEDERDTELVDKLYSERDVIFSLAIHELLHLIQNGFKFEVPALSQIRMQSFMEQNNQINDFLNEYCVFGPEHKVFSRDLYHSYEKFCKDNCLFTHNQNTFLDAVSLREGVVRSRIRINGERLRGFEGIGLNMQDSDMSYDNSYDIKTTVPSVHERSNLL